MNREPVAIANAVRLMLLAAITFGLHLTDGQLVASMAALEAGLTLFTRRAVTPVDTADDGATDFVGVLVAIALIVAIFCGLQYLGVI